MRFEIVIDMSGDMFSVDPKKTLANLLREEAVLIEKGCPSKEIIDDDGSVIGHYNISE
jgi:hypothetical protein